MASLLCSSSNVSSSDVPIIKQVWFEAGLLYRYSITQFIQVLKDFNFHSVLINPFQNTPYETPKIGDEVYALCDAVDSYAEEHANFSKFIIVGGASTWLHYPIIQYFKDSEYVMVMDDSGRDFEGTKNSLQYLKSQGVLTGLVVYPPHQDFMPVKNIINQGLLDYLMPCFYPYFINTNNFIIYINDMQAFKSWCTNNTKFLPAIQVFAGGSGVTNVYWRFPSRDEMQVLLNVLIDLNSWGITWFLPHSGESKRGETVEGFLDHQEVWDIIQNPIKREVGFFIPKEVFIVVLPIAVYIGYKGCKKIAKWIRM